MNVMRVSGLQDLLSHHLTDACVYGYTESIFVGALYIKCMMSQSRRDQSMWKRYLDEGRGDAWLWNDEGEEIMMPETHPWFPVEVI